jgi:phage gpG-like protein
MIIDGTVVGDREVVAKLTKYPEGLRKELRAAIERAGMRVQRHAKESKLSGQVLNVRTGRLRRSINLRVTEDPAMIQATVGTNVAYAKVHEFGFSGAVTVREHLRRSKATFRASLVRAHSRRFSMPQRSFLRSALSDLKAEIKTVLDAAVTRTTRNLRS